jgi:hypothetical protein
MAAITWRRQLGKRVNNGVNEGRRYGVAGVKKPASAWRGVSRRDVAWRDMCGTTDDDQ